MNLPPVISSMSIALMAIDIGLRTNPQAIPVPRPTREVWVPSQVAWVKALRNNSITQTREIPPASALSASSAISAGPSPVTPRETFPIAPIDSEATPISRSVG